jgi:hypothetical protein
MTRAGPKRAPTEPSTPEKRAAVERARQAAAARKSAGVPPALVEALAVSVPECIARWRADPWWTHERIVKTAHVCGDVLAHCGDIFVPDVRVRQECVDDAFEALTQAVAAGSFCPGGADFGGLHFESDPTWLARGES